MKLDIGCGDRPGLFGPDVIYADLRPVSLRPMVVCDIFKPLPFADHSFSYIIARHVIEHSPHRHTLDILKEWRRVLQHQGSLWIEVPNLEYYARQVVQRPWDPSNIVFIYGYQVWGSEDDEGTNSHRTGFTEPLMTKQLKSAGFADVTVKVTGATLVAQGVNG